MPIQLRILSGARAGQSESFEQARITFGRHPSNDLCFDAHADLNVSTRHGEIRRTDDGRYVLQDTGSTNGTFVNDERLQAGDARELRDGDVITFGAEGPRASVQIGRTSDPRVAAPITTRVPVAQRPAETAGSAAASTTPDGKRRPSTGERVAREVAHQTRGLKIAAAAGIVVIGGLGFAAYWAGHSEARTADAKLRALAASYDSSSRQLQERLQTMNDTALIQRLERERDSLVRVARDAKGSEAAAARQTLRKHQDAARAIGQLDLPAVHAANDAAVALIRTNVGSSGGLEATGFSVSPRGVIVTNRHVVIDGASHATQITVKLANTATWRPAHLVRVPRDTSIDLAIVQLDDAQRVPTVTGVSPNVDVPVGGAIATLGFPDGTDLPMEGATAKTTLTLGTVSKLTNDLLQIDSYASHGSSGSPVFDSHGHVVGVIYGGARGSGGRIVYAVPARLVTELLQSK